MQQQNLVVGRHLREVVFIASARVEGTVEGLCRISQRIAVCGGGRRYSSHRFSKVVENLCKQSVVKVDANGLAHVRVTQTVQAQRDPGFVEMGIEARGSLECPDVKLFRILESYLRFVGDRRVACRALIDSPLA